MKEQKNVTLRPLHPYHTNRRKNKIIVYLIRHAETLDNINGIIQGQDDSPLTLNGIETSKTNFSSLKNMGIDLVVSSPIGRARETAKILCDTIGLSSDTIVYDDAFKEIDLGKWVKKSKSDLITEDGLQSYRCYVEQPQLFNPNNGESLYDLQCRVKKGYKDILSRFHKYKSIAIVSHSVSIRTLLLSIENKGMENVWDYKLSSSSVTTILVENDISKIISIGN